MAPVVSVLTVCRNQEQYIKQTIESVLLQNTTFEWEYIIIDDGSTDASKTLIQHYADNYKGIIKFYHWPDNIGLLYTYMYGFNKARGEYIAFCDGDDYWIDPKKIQKQYDFMQENRFCGSVFTRAIIETETSIEYSTMPPKYLDYDTMLKSGHMFSPTQFFRMDDVKMFWNEMARKNFFIWDYPIWLYLTRFYKIGYLEDVTAVYRKMQGSFTNTKSRRRRLTLVLGVLKIKIYFILKYGCKLSTLCYMTYRFARDIYSVIFKRWYKR